MPGAEQQSPRVQSLSPDHTGAPGAKTPLLPLPPSVVQLRGSKVPRRPCLVHCSLLALHHHPPGTRVAEPLSLPAASTPTGPQTPSLPILKDNKLLLSFYCVLGPVLGPLGVITTTGLSHWEPQWRTSSTSIWYHFPPALFLCCPLLSYISLK